MTQRIHAATTRHGWHSGGAGLAWLAGGLIGLALGHPASAQLDRTLPPPATTPPSAYRFPASAALRAGRPAAAPMPGTHISITDHLTEIVPEIQVALEAGDLRAQDAYLGALRRLERQPAEGSLEEIAIRRYFIGRLLYTLARSGRRDSTAFVEAIDYFRQTEEAGDRVPHGYGTMAAYFIGCCHLQLFLRDAGANEPYRERLGAARAAFDRCAGLQPAGELHSIEYRARLMRGICGLLAGFVDLARSHGELDPDAQELLEAGTDALGRELSGAGTSRYSATERRTFAVYAGIGQYLLGQRLLLRRYTTEVDPCNLRGGGELGLATGDAAVRDHFRAASQRFRDAGTWAGLEALSSWQLGRAPGTARQEYIAVILPRLVHTASVQQREASFWIETEGLIGALTQIRDDPVPAYDPAPPPASFFGRQADAWPVLRERRAHLVAELAQLATGLRAFLDSGRRPIPAAPAPAGGSPAGPGAGAGRGATALAAGAAAYGRFNALGRGLLIHGPFAPAPGGECYCDASMMVGLALRSRMIDARRIELYRDLRRFLAPCHDARPILLGVFLGRELQLLNDPQAPSTAELVSLLDDARQLAGSDRGLAREVCYFGRELGRQADGNCLEDDPRALWLDLPDQDRLGVDRTTCQLRQHLESLGQAGTLCSLAPAWSIVRQAITRNQCATRFPGLTLPPLAEPDIRFDCLQTGDWLRARLAAALLEELTVLQRMHGVSPLELVQLPSDFDETGDPAVRVTLDLGLPGTAKHLSVYRAGDGDAARPPRVDTELSAARTTIDLPPMTRWLVCSDPAGQLMSCQWVVASEDSQQIGFDYAPERTLEPAASSVACTVVDFTSDVLLASRLNEPFYRLVYWRECHPFDSRNALRTFDDEQRHPIAIAATDDGWLYYVDRDQDALRRMRITTRREEQDDQSVAASDTIPSLVDPVDLTIAGQVCLVLNEAGELTSIDLTSGARGAAVSLETDGALADPHYAAIEAVEAGDRFAVLVAETTVPRIIYLEYDAGAGRFSKPRDCPDLGAAIGLRLPSHIARAWDADTKQWTFLVADLASDRCFVFDARGVYLGSHRYPGESGVRAVMRTSGGRLALGGATRLVCPRP